MNKPVKPAAHGAIDYVLSGVQLAAPALLKLGPGATKTFGALGVGMLALNAFTDTPAGIKRKVPFDTHGKADLGLLAGMGLLTLAPMIRKNKKVLRFHLGLLAVAIAHYVLTDYASD